MSKSAEPYVAKKLLIPQDRFFAEVDALLEQIDELANLNAEDSRFKLWRKQAQALLDHALGEHSQQAHDFGWISYEPLVYADDDLGYGWGDGHPQHHNEEFTSGLQSAKEHLLSIRAEVEKYFESKDESTPAKGGRVRTIGRQVFVVHGHDTELLLKVKEFLREIHLDPIVLREQPNQGRTIIEKFENFSDVGFAIALLTSDDLVLHDGGGSSREYRARQNVVLELGYFMGALGRSRVAVLCDKNVARPGDIDGMVYATTESDASWQLSIARELHAAGYEVDLNRLLD